MSAKQAYHGRLPDPSRRRGGRDRSEARAGWAFVTPATIGFAAFILLPLLMTIYYSFTEYNLFNPPEWVGTANYAGLGGDARLGKVYLNTAIFTLLAVPLNVGIGLGLALAVNRRMPRWLSVAIRSAFFAPTLVGLIFIAIVWQFFYQTDGGVFNYYLSLLGVGPIPWLSDPTWGMISIVILDVWKNLGLAMLILLAALQDIPKSYYEAASLDGASSFRQLRSITLPIISSQIFFVTTLYLVGALKVFDSIVVLTGGGPGDGTRSIVMYIYEEAFGSMNFGYASAMAVTLLVIIVLITALQFRGSRKWVHHV